MALEVEDGTGKANAESYISVADATAHFAGRGKGDAWDAVEDKEAALRKATDYMGQEYRTRWLGLRANSGQALDWPRAYVPKFDAPGGYGANPDYYLLTDIPVEVKRACAELALRSNAEDLAPDETQGALEKTVGPITIKLDPDSPSRKQWTAVDLLLKPLLKPTSGAVNVVRT